MLLNRYVKNRRILLLSLIFLVPILIFMVFTNIGGEKTSEKIHTIIVYYSEDCGCCVDYIEKLKEIEGVKIVSIINRTEWLNIRSKYSIPEKYVSCHSMLIDNRHFVEGHLQFNVVKQLLQLEKPLVLSNPDHEDSPKYYIITRDKIIRCRSTEDLGQCASSI